MYGDGVPEFSDLNEPDRLFGPVCGIGKCGIRSGYHRPDFGPVLEWAETQNMKYLTSALLLSK